MKKMKTKYYKKYKIIYKYIKSGTKLKLHKNQLFVRFKNV